jgi:hypothetical protein
MSLSFRDRTLSALTAGLSSSSTDVSAVYPLVAFYDILGRKVEVLLFYSVQYTTRDFDEIFVSNL